MIKRCAGCAREIEVAAAGFGLEGEADGARWRLVTVSNHDGPLSLWLGPCCLDTGDQAGAQRCGDALIELVRYPAERPDPAAPFLRVVK